MSRDFRPYRLYTYLVSGIRKNKFLFRHLFGFSAPDANWGQYWDWTTVVLIKAIKRYLQPGMRFLDLGCGPYAVLARYLLLREGSSSVVAADHCSELIDFAKANDPNSGIQYLYSDLFSAVDGAFDLIAFNAPYIDTDKGKARGLFPDKLALKRFCGGKKGIETVQRFLENLPQHLQPDGKALLGVNHYHIEPGILQAAIVKSEFTSVQTLHDPFTKSCVYVLQRKEK